MDDPNRIDWCQNIDSFSIFNSYSSSSSISPSLPYSSLSSSHIRIQRLNEITEGLLQILTHKYQLVIVSNWWWMVFVVLILNKDTRKSVVWEKMVNKVGVMERTISMYRLMATTRWMMPCLVIDRPINDCQSVLGRITGRGKMISVRMVFCVLIR